VKYVSDSMWKKLERQGNITDAAKTIMKELKYNCDRIQEHPTEYQIIYEHYLSYAYILSMNNVPASLFSELKQTRKEIQQVIKTL